MKIVFMGTPDFAVPALKAIAEKHDVVCVYTQAPKEAGRGMELKKSSVQLFAESKGIEVRFPKSLRNVEEQERFKALNADITVVAAYGLILPLPILEGFPKGCINIHGSLLPRWRGAAPLQRAIEAGDKETGITIMKMDEGLDTGDMLLKGSIVIDNNTTAGVLHDAMAELGAKLIVEYLENMDDIKPEKQDESLVTYAHKIDKAESKLDFNTKVEAIERKIRAFNPYPATYFEHAGERFKVLEVRIAELTNIAVGGVKQESNRLFIGCVDGAIEIIKIQRAGKKACLVKELLNGYSFL